MPLATLSQVLLPAQERGYAVGAFNANNLEYVQAIIEGASRCASPVIIQVSQGAIKYAGLEYIVAMVKTAASLTEIPVVLHLDHGTDLDIVKRCINSGFTSVMFDGSSLPFDENVRLTREMADLAHGAGISAEGELGRVPSSDRDWTREELTKLMTDPSQAARFASLTEVDALAVSVGSVHQMKERTVLLDIERVEAIREVVSTPLVLHGSSGVAPQSIREAVAQGICKVNIATALNLVFMRAVRDGLIKDPAQTDPRKILGPARAAVASVVADNIEILGSSGKAS